MSVATEPITEKSSVSAMLVVGIIVLIGSLAFTVGLFFEHGQSPDFTDFAVYHTAGAKAIGHRTVYDVKGHYQFKYSPFTAVLFGAAVGHWPKETAQWIWYVLNCVGWAILFALLFREVLRQNRDSIQLSPGQQMVLFGLMLLGCTVGLRDELKLGQANLVCYLFAFAFFKAYDRDRKSLGSKILVGFCLSMAIQFKLYCCLFVPYLFFRKDWAILVWTVVWTLVCLFVIQGLYHGFSFAFDETVRWGTTLTKSSAGLSGSHFDGSLMGILRKNLPYFHIPTIVWFLGCVLFLVLQWKVRDFSPWMNFAYILAAINILNPLVWPYWIVLVVPMYLQVMVEGFRWFERRQWKLAGWTLALAVGLILIDKYQNWTVSLYWGWLLLMTFALLVTGLWAEARNPKGRVVPEKFS